MSGWDGGSGMAGTEDCLFFWDLWVMRSGRMNAGGLSVRDMRGAGAGGSGGFTGKEGTCGSGAAPGRSRRSTALLTPTKRSAAARMSAAAKTAV